MASPGPIPLFTRLVSVWSSLSLRSDVDDVVLELLGQFSLEKIYAGPANAHVYQNLVITLLAKLNIIFYIQKLTLTGNDAHNSRHPSYPVSLEVTLRCIEFTLQIIDEDCTTPWKRQAVRDKYLAEFLLSALRTAVLHPRASASDNGRSRFARICASLEHILDADPGPRPFLLEVCRLTVALDPDALGLPLRMRDGFPNLTSELVGKTPANPVSFIAMSEALTVPLHSTPFQIA